MRWSSKWLRGTSLLCLLLCSTARANYTFVFDQSTYTVDPGGTVSVQVFLRETQTSLLATDGLITAGVQLEFTGLAGATQPARVASPADILGNPAFDDFAGPTRYLPVPGFGSNTAGIEENVDLFSPPVFGSGSPLQILLATFQVTAGMVPGEVTQLRATDLFPPPSDNTITGAFPFGMALDGTAIGIGDGLATLRVLGEPTMLVPEPSSLALLAIGLGLVWGRRCRLSNSER